MSRPDDVADQVLALLPSAVDGQVRVTASVASLTRFANSFIHQNVADEGTEVELTVAKGRQVATASAHVSDTAALERFVASVAEAASVAPEMADWPGVADAGEITGHAPEPGAASVTPGDRAEVVAAFIEAAPELESAGFCQSDHADVVLATTGGRRARGSSAGAVIDGIQRTATTSGSGHSASRRFADLDGASAGRLAGDRATRFETVTDVEPGEYEMVLGPEASATLGLFLGFYGFNGKRVAEGQSFVRLGEQQFDPAFELIDDGARPMSFGVGFDTEGTPKQRTELIADGVCRNVAVDRRQSEALGLPTTGNATMFNGSYFGPLPTDLCVTPGEASVDDLIGSVERGLYVATFSYCRILDPRTTVTTGLTRNGTFVIRDGEIVGTAANLRFTQSFADAVSPGKVLGVASDARMARAEFGPGLVQAPTMRLRSWRITGNASG